MSYARITCALKALGTDDEIRAVEVGMREFFGNRMFTIDTLSFVPEGMSDPVEKAIAAGNKSTWEWAIDFKVRSEGSIALPADELLRAEIQAKLLTLADGELFKDAERAVRSLTVESVVTSPVFDLMHIDV